MSSSLESKVVLDTERKDTKKCFCSSKRIEEKEDSRTGISWFETAGEVEKRKRNIKSSVRRREMRKKTIR